MTNQTRTRLIVSLALGLTAAAVHAQGNVPPNDPADAFTMKQVGNGQVEISRQGHKAVVMNLATKRDKNIIAVQVKNPHSNAGGFFTYHEKERRIETGANGKQFLVQINENGTVNIGTTVCDGRKDQACIATALEHALQGVPVEGVMAMQASLNDVLGSPNTPLGREIKQTFRNLVHDMVKHEKKH